MSRRKPKEKPKQFCMDIKTSKKNLEKYRNDIEKFVIYLYSKKFQDSLDQKDFFVVLDTKGRKVCMSPVRKVNAIYEKIAKIHEKIEKLKSLRTDDKNFSFSKPYADILQHHIGQKKIQMPKGVHWLTLEHNGPYISWIQNPYKPHKVPIQYKGKDYELNPEEEEVANFYARRITTDQKSEDKWTKNSLFNKNFWIDFQKYLSPSHKKTFKSLKDLNFEKIRLELIRQKENITQKEKIEKKKKAAERKEEYGYAVVNGIKEPVGNFTVEPASLYIGRGDNKNRGKIKPRVYPSEITINIGKKSKVPSPPRGYKWKKVIHNQKARWIMSWKDGITGSMKYVYLGAQSQFKSSADQQKFDKARKLNKFIKEIRKGYEKSIISKDPTQRQLGTVMYLIDHYGIRVGGPNDEKTAETFGASTLLVSHVKLLGSRKIRLHFIGKDSIRFDKVMEVSSQVYKNISEFIKGKPGKMDLFYLISACDINNYLKSFDKDISAKVFRTRLGSFLMKRELDQLKIVKSWNARQKKLAFEKANAVVAEQLNHQKAVTKKATATLTKQKKELTALRKELREKKKAGNKKTKSLETRIKAKIVSIKLKEVAGKISTGTSKQNYIDPRIIFAWTKDKDIKINTVYTKTLLNKFKWAEDTPASWDYNNSPLNPQFNKLEPSLENVCVIENTPDIPPPIQQKRDVENLIDFLKKYGYALFEYENSNIRIKRISKPSKLMKTSSKPYRDIYNMIKYLIKNDMIGLGYILIWAVCQDSEKYDYIKNNLQNINFGKKVKKLL